jgi:hypothetical protein
VVQLLSFPYLNEVWRNKLDLYNGQFALNFTDTMLIENHATELFTDEDIQALRNFIQHEILSQEIDRNRLAKIIISEDGKGCGYRGYWKPRFIPANDSDQIVNLKAVIVLNASFLLTLDDLKETLAHEYGHHWTLSYLAINQQIRVFEQRLPEEYYEHRSLNKTDTVYHINECSQNYFWTQCDKEIIAEDYRVLFTPSNQDHCMVNDTLPYPNQATRQYIENLCN